MGHRSPTESCVSALGAQTPGGRALLPPAPNQVSCQCCEAPSSRSVTSLLLDWSRVCADLLGNTSADVERASVKIK